MTQYENLVVSALFCSAVIGQSFSYPDFHSTAGLNLLQNSQVTASGSLQLTGSGSGQAGWAWHSTPMPVINGFDTTFTFRITPQPGAVIGEGMAFVIHNSPSGSLATGANGSALGYGGVTTGGIERSVVIELDTLQQWWLGDGSSNELSIHTGGLLENSENEDQSIGRTTPLGTFADGQVHTLRIQYIQGSLRIYHNDLTTPVLQRPYDWSAGGTWITTTPVGGIEPDQGRSFVGFCATSGLPLGEQQTEILTWDWTSVPLTDECGDGTLGGDTLLVNGSGGGAARRVPVALGYPFELAINNPPAFGPGAPYLLFASSSAQPGAFGSVLGFGSACFPMLPMGPTELILADSFGFGLGSLPAAPSPQTFMIPGNVFSQPTRLTLQAVTLDSASPLTLGLTNALDLDVRDYPAPTITSVIPAIPGGQVYVQGTDFMPGALAYQGGVSVNSTWVNSELLSYPQPSPAACQVPIYIANPDGQVSGTVTTNQPPIVTGLLPTSVPIAGGTLLSIYGLGLAGLTVTIGQVPAQVVSVRSTYIRVVVPPGPPGGGASPVVISSYTGCSVTYFITYI